jgi:hypothetical protein
MIDYRDGKTYYYRSVRRNGQPRREYVGSGYFAELAWSLDEVTRQVQREEQEQAERRFWREDRRMDKLEAKLDRVAERIERAVSSAMQAAGYHRHGYHGRWRRARTMKTLTDHHVKTRDKLTRKQHDARSIEYKDLLEGCLKNTLSDNEMDRFGKLTRECGTAHTIGGPGENLVRDIATHFGGPPKSQIGEITFKAWWADTLAEVTGENPSPIERMLAFRIVCTWALMNIFERRYLQWANELTASQDNTMGRRIARIHGQFLRACKALEEIRKVPVPTVNLVNVSLGNSTAAVRLKPPPMAEAIESATTTGDTN